MRARNRWFTAAIAAGVCLLLFGNRGFRRLVRQTVELRHLRRDFDALRKEEAQLRSKVDAASHSDRVLEAEARSQLGLIKPGEIEYRFPPPNKDEQ
mgnify:CR=1 FL=1